MTAPTDAEPTTDEMIAWCERLAEASEAAARERDKATDELGALLGLGHTYQARMLRAIAARLRETAETPRPDGHGPA